MTPDTEAPEYEARLSDLLASARAMLRRRWLTIMLVTAAVLAAGIAAILSMTPRYEAVARVRIDPSLNPLSGQGDQADLGSEAIETEVTVLSSPDLARDVVQKLKLQNDPEFTQTLRDEETAGPISAAERLNMVTDEVLAHLNVGREKLTYILAVRFESRDPLKAARIANAFAQTYIETRVGLRMGSATRQADFFRQRLGEMEAESRRTDAQLAQFRAANGLVQSGGNGNITDQQVAPLSTELATAQSNAAEARSNYAAARAQIATGGLDAVSAVRSSPVIGDLRRQRAEVTRNLGEIDARYGPRHPESIKVNEQLGALDAQIKAEANRAVGSLEAEARAADARAASLRGTLRSLAGQQARNTRASAIAAGLEQQAATKRAAYDRMSQLSLESTQSVRNSIAQAEIVDAAQPPQTPAAPRKAALGALAAVTALSIGFGAGIVQELLAAGIRSVADLQSRSGLNVLAVLPRLGKRRFWRRKVSPAQSLLSDPTSMFAEALRNARTSIIGVRSGSSPAVIAVTSALPGEGKTTTALSLARIVAMNGSRTLLVDCDLRRAQLRSVAAQPVLANSVKGDLVAVLRGEAALEQSVVSDAVEGLDLLTVSAPHFTAEDLLGGEAMKALLAKARAAYRFVILDLPPVLGVADTRTVAAQADAVVFVVKWGSTPPAAIETALASLRADGTKVLGAIFSQVDPNSEAIGGTYYSKQYAAYYTRAA